MCSTIHDDWALEPFFNSFSFFFILFYVRRDQNSKPDGNIVYVDSRVCLAIRGSSMFFTIICIDLPHLCV